MYLTELTEIRKGKQGTQDTINLMVEDAVKASRDFAFIKKARNILRVNKVDPRNERAIADVFFKWMKKNIAFVRDPSTAEMVQYPMRTIEEKMGDCDDHTTLFAAFNLAVGNKVRYVTIGRNQHFFRHVYTEVQDSEENWIPYDSVVKGSYPGWEPTKYKIKRVWYMNGNFVDLKDYATIPVKEKAGEEARLDKKLRAAKIQNAKQGRIFMKRELPPDAPSQIDATLKEVRKRSAVIDDEMVNNEQDIEKALIMRLVDDDIEIKNTYSFLKEFNDVGRK